MKPSPIIQTVCGNGLCIEVRKYGHRFGFDVKCGKLRKKIRRYKLEDAVRLAKELTAVAVAGKFKALTVPDSEWIEFQQGKLKNATVVEAIEQFIRAKKGQGLKGITVEDYARSLRLFAAQFPGPLMDISPDAVRAWLDGKKVSPKRWNNLRSALIALVRFARTTGLIPEKLTAIERIAKKPIPRKQEAALPIITKLPSVEELRPFVHKLAANPSGAVVIALTYQPERENFAKYGICFFYKEERERMRKGILAVNRERKKRGEAPTSAPISK